MPVDGVYLFLNSFEVIFRQVPIFGLKEELDLGSKDSGVFGLLGWALEGGLIVFLKRGHLTQDQKFQSCSIE
jgi:hypothetical protein